MKRYVIIFAVVIFCCVTFMSISFAQDNGIDGIFIKLEQDYRQDFEDPSKIEDSFNSLNCDPAVSVPTADNADNKVFQLNSHPPAGAPTIQPYSIPVFGNNLSDYIVEVDVKQLFCGSSSNGSFSVGLRALSAAAKHYRFAYFDVINYNESTGKAVSSGVKYRDTIGIAHTASSSNVTNWTIGSLRTDKVDSPILGILNTNASARNFDEFYRMKCAIVGNTAAMKVETLDGVTLKDVTATLSELDDEYTVATGHTLLSGHGTNVQFDNISIYKAYLAKDIKLVLRDSAISPNRPVPYEVRAYKDENDYIILPAGSVEFDYDYSEIEVDEENSTITLLVPSAAQITAIARDAMSDKDISHSLNLDFSSDATDSIDAAERLELDVSPNVGSDFIVEDFILPITGLNDTNITWTSSNPDVIQIETNSAKVVRPETGADNITVVLTATIDKNGVTTTREFTVTVLISDQRVVQMDIDDLQFDKVRLTNKEVLTLQTTGTNGSSISWKSQNTAVISIENGENNQLGVVTAPQYSDVDASLTATVTKGTATQVVTFSFVVQGLGIRPPTTSSGGGGGGGSISRTFDKTPVAVVTPPDLTQSEVLQSDTIQEDKQEEGNGAEQEGQDNDLFLFKDLQDVPWATQYILDLAKKNIISNVEGFEPNRPVTREEFVKMIVVAFDLPMTEENVDFQDVIDGEWYCQYISAASKAGIVNGVGSTEFGVGNPITRQDMITMTFRAIEMVGTDVKGKDTPLNFSDEHDIAEYALKYVRSALALGIISGYPDGSFAPNDNATRAETAKFLSGVLNSVFITR